MWILRKTWYYQYSQGKNLRLKRKYIGFENLSPDSGRISVSTFGPLKSLNGDHGATEINRLLSTVWSGAELNNITTEKLWELSVSKAKIENAPQFKEDVL